METRTETSRGREMKKPVISGSMEARQLAAGILEVMSGERGPAEVSEALGISTMRYYALEERAIQGMVKSLEVRPRGRKAVSTEEAIAKLEKERDRLKRELGRSQALLRVVRKSVRLTELSKPAKKSRNRGSRPKKLIERLKSPDAVPPPVHKADDSP
jgi:hypothetical protein